MAWTAPASYGVGDVLTAANLNTYLRDNLKYLKGQAGAVSLEDNLGVVDATPTSDWVPTNQYMTIATAASPGSASVALKGARSGSDSAFAVLYGINLSATGSDKTGGAVSFNRDGAANSANISFLTRNAGAIAEGMRIDKAGNLGVGITAPQGKLHAFDTESGIFLWRTATVVGSTVAVLAAGSVVAGLAGFYIVYDGSNRSSGSIPNIAATGTLAVTHTLHTGTGTYVLHLNANGSVDVQRTSGSGTGQISLWLLYH